MYTAAHWIQLPENMELLTQAFVLVSSSISTVLGVLRLVEHFGAKRKKERR